MLILLPRFKTVENVGVKCRQHILQGTTTNIQRGNKFGLELESRNFEIYFGQFSGFQSLNNTAHNTVKLIILQPVFSYEISFSGSSDTTNACNVFNIFRGLRFQRYSFPGF